MTVQVQREFVLPDSIVRIHATGCTDRGVVRAINEDSSLVSGSCFVVADGMGGHEHGDLASQTAVATFEHLIADDAPARAEQVLESITAAISHDGRINVAESELLRTICGVLHCPLPAMLERG